ncbi:MAG: ATP-grasp domain-containing protein [Chloroflexi bacterium]|nr:ATP-grasp domain-containing protein [Chloroflexota bacterium]
MAGAPSPGRRVQSNGRTPTAQACRTRPVRTGGRNDGVPVPTARPIERLLIANRGEIAVRVIRACAALGIRSIAVYSEADRDALHVRLADEAHLLGPGPASASYLNVERILEAARGSDAQAVHPGYGFLSENAAFAEACAAAGLIFVGPPPAALRLLGDKAAARKLAAAHGVPVVPGYDGAAQDDPTLAAEAARIGVPLLVKAAAGGGGRGMRAVSSLDQLPEAIAAARREALAAFGDDTLILERLIERARHVEVQVLGDRHGALVHLGERDCSVQRRHQKVVEESPGPAVTPELRGALGEAALRVAGAAGYVGAGTCEFLVGPDGQFWFIEMNARLQVEHPVTELVTGIDLVQKQLEIAAGLPLGLAQADVALRGHAVECRVYAEDPARADLPTPGRLGRFRPPVGPGLRNDVGYADGDRVPPFYDTMLGKLIAYGETRAEAIGLARAALERYEIEGLPTNRTLLTWILDHPTFQDGAATTDFLSMARPGDTDLADVPPVALAAAAAAWLSEIGRDGGDDGHSQASTDGTLGDWRIGGQGVITFWQAAPDADPVAVVADRESPRRWRVTVAEDRFDVTVTGLDDLLLVRPLVVRPVGGQTEVPSASPAGPTGAVPASPAGPTLAEGSAAPIRCRVAVEWARGRVVVTHGGDRSVATLAAPPAAAPTGRHHPGGRAPGLEAPMPGRVVRILAAPGDVVREHQPLLIVEAMKIENVVAAPRDGVVASVLCAEGDAVAGGQVLVELASL